MATATDTVNDRRDRVVEARWRITYKYTTNHISGTVDADPEFFHDEGEAMKRYVELRHGDAEFPYQGQGRQYRRSDVKLWKINGWQEVL